jgi:hypothetical protein
VEFGKRILNRNDCKALPCFHTFYCYVSCYLSLAKFIYITWQIVASGLCCFNTCNVLSVMVFVFANAHINNASLLTGYHRSLPYLFLILYSIIIISLQIFLYYFHHEAIVGHDSIR